jgi:hypothetical protein
MRLYSAVLSALLVSTIAVSSAPAGVITGMAAMGASETQGNNYTGSWVPYLVNLRGVNFGGSQNPYNVAVGGATSTTLLSPQQQHIKVRNFVQQGKVDVASLSIGGNDYGGNALNLLLGNVNPEVLADQVIDNISTAIDTVLSADPKGMIVWSVPDMSKTAIGQQYVVTPELQAIADNFMDLVNIPLKQEVLDRGLVYIDLAQTMADLESSPLYVGGVLINTKTASSNATHLWQDGIHPGAVGNGLFANLALTALNLGYGTNYSLLSDLEILTAAGLASSYTGPTSQINYAQYVTVPVPELSSSTLVGMLFIGASIVVMTKRSNMRPIERTMKMD